jgi:predicted ATP-grasp superfamily ATP-dependent carboligase
MLVLVQIANKMGFKKNCILIAGCEDPEWKYVAQNINQLQAEESFLLRCNVV